MGAIRGFQKKAGGLQVFRSVDIASIAYMQGAFEEMINCCKNLDQKSGRDVIDGILFALKFSGCAISFEEVNDYVNLIMGKKI